MMMTKSSMTLTKKSKKMLEKIKFALIWFQNKISQSISWRSAEDKILLLATIKILLTKSLIKFLIMIILPNQIKMTSKNIFKIKIFLFKDKAIKIQITRISKKKCKKNI